MDGADGSLSSRMRDVHYSQRAGDTGRDIVRNKEYSEFAGPKTLRFACRSPSFRCRHNDGGHGTFPEIITLQLCLPK
jgi:hypothetical protein